MQPTLSATLSSQAVQTSSLSSSGLSPTPHHRIQVIRRDGTSTALNISKIRAVVDWACAKLNANSIALEAGLTTRLRDGISTREIQDNLVNCALEMCSPEEPDWRYVAGRLHIWGLWKDILVSRGYQYGQYATTVKEKVASGQYDERMSLYSAKELEEAGNWINSDWDTDYDYAGVVLLTSRYLLPNELPQEALLTCALLLALPENPENRLAWAKRFYEAIASRKVSLATPILANLRVPKGSLTSCFPANTPVLTQDGFKPIETIDIGEVVLTHENRLRTVIATNQRYFQGNLVTLKVDGIETLITATNEHLFLVIKSEDASCQRLKSQNLCLTSQGQRQRCFTLARQYRENCAELTKSFFPTWTEAENIRPGDWMQIPFNSEVRDLQELSLTDFIADHDIVVVDGKIVRLNVDGTPNQQLHHPLAKIPINEEFMLLLGYYLAEGYASPENNVVSLTFNSRETQYIEESSRIFESLFQVKPVIETKKDNSTCVKLYSKWVSQFFANLIGTGFNQKSLPPQIMFAAPVLQRHLLKGVFRGDACVTQNTLKLTLCNQALIDQLFELCLRNSLSPSVTKAQKGKLGTQNPYNLTLTFSQDADFIVEVGKHLNQFKSVKTYYRCVWVDGKFYRKISGVEIKSLETEILVYDLQVAEDSSFCVGRMAAHNCFIVALDDNLESIFREITNAARISKNGGGVGANVSRIRATGSVVMGKPNASGGVIPWIKLLNDTAIAVNQGGRRAGAVTVGLDIWHLDVPEFLEMQTENGDQRRKAYDIFPQLILPDEFMRRVMNKAEWTLVDPYEVRTNLGIELAELWGEEFEKAYALIESKLGQEITLYKQVNARELFKEIMRSQVETGMPYLAFKDTINRANPNKHAGYIPGVNLCVAGETRILTDKGQFAIADLVGEQVNVWNGSEWSGILVKKTGENQPLLKVRFSNGESLECTYYHKFHIQKDYKGTVEIVEAKDLKQGDKLIKYQLPLVQSENDINFPYAYTSGFFCGDGSYGGKGIPEIDLYGVKKELLPFLAVRNKYRGGGSLENGTQWRKETNIVAVYHDIKQDRIICKLPLDIPAKFTVPLNGYTIKSRLDWLAGLLDADGTVARNSSNESLQIASVNRQFLLDIRLMLQTLGVDSKVTLMDDAGYRLMPNGTGNYQEYLCQSKYRLLISSVGLFQLGQLGLKTHRLQWNLKEPQRSASQFIQVEEVELTCRRDDTYCFTEPKRHLGMFNGILTGQCTESFSNVTPGQDAHCCNLVSLNLANIETAELEDCCQISVRILDNTIELTSPPFEDAANHNNKYRTIGVGAMGLADWLAKNRFSYDHLTQISHLFEDIGYYCTQASMELAKERAPYNVFAGSDWSKGLLIGSKPVEWFQENAAQPERWLKLSDDIQTYGIRNSHITAIAPNTSSSLVQGCTASVLPVYSRFFYDKWAKGTVPIAPPFINNCFWFYPENKNLDQNKVVKAVATIQQWIDTGISMELLFNLNHGVYFPDQPDKGLTAKDIFDTLVLSWKEGCKAVYYVRTVQKDNFKESEAGCSACAN